MSKGFRREIVCILIKNVRVNKRAEIKWQVFVTIMRVSSFSHKIPLHTLPHNSKNMRMLYRNYNS